MMSLEKLFRKSSAHSKTSFVGISSEVCLAHLPSGRGLVNIQLGHWGQREVRGGGQRGRGTYW
jgi:hypothetical protein